LITPLVLSFFPLLSPLFEPFDFLVGLLDFLDSLVARLSSFEHLLLGGLQLSVVLDFDFTAHLLFFSGPLLLLLLHALLHDVRRLADVASDRDDVDLFFDGNAGEVGVVGARAGDREERGSLILSDDGTIDGLAVQSEEGAWASFPWKDVQDVPGAEIAPLWFTIDIETETGAYATNEGVATAASEVTVDFIQLQEDTSRLSLVLSATDVAGNTFIRGPVVLE
jgi:hypothetical protein